MDEKVCLQTTAENYMTIVQQRMQFHWSTYSPYICWPQCPPAYKTLCSLIVRTSQTSEFTVVVA